MVRKKTKSRKSAAEEAGNSIPNEEQGVDRPDKDVRAFERAEAPAFNARAERVLGTK